MQMRLGEGGGEEKQGEGEGEKGAGEQSGVSAEAANTSSSPTSSMRRLLTGVPSRVGYFLHKPPHGLEVGRAIRRSQPSTYHQHIHPSPLLFSLCLSPVCAAVRAALLQPAEVESAPPRLPSLQRCR